jgi:hypothetical protein
MESKEELISINKGTSIEGTAKITKDFISNFPTYNDQLSLSSK